jgi:hypothetical protein
MSFNENIKIILKSCKVFFFKLQIVDCGSKLRFSHDKTIKNLTFKPYYMLTQAFMNPSKRDFN